MEGLKFLSWFLERTPISIAVTAIQLYICSVFQAPCSTLQIMSTHIRPRSRPQQSFVFESLEPGEVSTGVVCFCVSRVQIATKGAVGSLDVWSVKCNVKSGLINLCLFDLATQKTDRMVLKWDTLPGTDKGGSESNQSYPVMLSASTGVIYCKTAPFNPLGDPGSPSDSGNGT